MALLAYLVFETIMGYNCAIKSENENKDNNITLKAIHYTPNI